jgi:hypothetical protein
MPTPRMTSQSLTRGGYCSSTITEFVVPAVLFAWSVLLVAIATFLVLCVTLLDGNR